MEITLPLFKPDIVLAESIKLGRAVKLFIDEYDAIMASPPTFKRGADTALALNKLHKALVFWGILTNQQIQAGNVDKAIIEHNEHEESK